MVIFCAVGGRASLIGAVYGTLLVNFGKTFFSESYPELWLFFMGGLFIAVVMFFPDGLAGIWTKYSHKLSFFKKKFSVTAAATEKVEPVLEVAVIEPVVVTDSAKKDAAKKVVKEMDVTNIKGAKA